MRVKMAGVVSAIRTGILIGLLLPLLSCSEGVKEPPILPKTSPSLQTSGGQAVSQRYLWTYTLIYLDPVSLECQILPDRSTTTHYNALKWLEQAPCDDCLSVQGIKPSDHGSLLVDVRIKHPINYPSLTGFDVRGIVMLPGSLNFPVAGVITQNPKVGEAFLINAEGYTALYNPTTVGNGSSGLQGYLKGKFASNSLPNATLNGFFRYASQDPANRRNAFYSGDAITRSLDFKPPSGPFTFGYAIDVNWIPPTNLPVSDPMLDFLPEANSPEPWKITVGNEPIIENGQTVLTIDVYDRQGDSTHKNPVVECPELFDGIMSAVWIDYGVGYSRYEITIENSKNAPQGDYLCLVAVEAHENDPVNKPMLDLTAYQLRKISVSPGNLIWAKRADALGVAITELSDDSTVVTGFFYGSATFGEGEPNETVLVAEDYPDVFIARYNPDGRLAWARRSGGDELYNEYAADLAITALSNDSFTVTGFFEGQTTFGQGEPNETVLYSTGFGDVFIARFNPDGTLVWAKSAGGTDIDYDYAIARGIAALSDDSIVITGGFTGSITLGAGETNETTLISSGGEDNFLARYNPDGTLSWAKRAGGDKEDRVNGITALADGSTAITGAFRSATFGPDEPNETHLSCGSEYRVFIARYLSDGTLEWAKCVGGRYGGSSGGMSITATSDNSMVVTGYFNLWVTFGEGEPNETEFYVEYWPDLFVARYNPDGTLAWAKRAGGIRSDVGISIKTLSDNSTVVTGQIEGSTGYDIIFGTGEPNETVLFSEGWRDLFVARYNYDGTLVWAKSAGGMDNWDLAFGVTALSDDSSVVTGSFYAPAIFGKGESNETILEPSGMFIARYSK